MRHRFFALALLAFVSSRADGARFRAAPLPAWVQPLPIPRDSEVAVIGGQRLLLSDRQLRFGAHTAERFIHWARQVADASGLQGATQLNIEFDPSYETVLLHSVTIVRGAQRLDRLRLAAIKVVQREPNLESQMYDGRQSLVLFLDDVRVGDILDVQFSISGADPTLAGHIEAMFPLGLGDPVGRIRVRLLVPHGHRLHLRPQGPNAASVVPTIGETPDGDEYVFDRANTPAYAFEVRSPSWLFAIPMMQISDFEDWAAVARWGATLVRAPASPSSAVRKQARALRDQSASLDDFVRAATYFVQNQIRYIGLETGLSRRQSADPGVVLARRFGDCKDKTALLASLLQAEGVSAEPALVSTNLLDHLDDSLPSAETFNHVILHVSSREGGERWIDATASQQGGELARTRFSPFGRALVLQPETAGLSKLLPEVPLEPAWRIRERYELPEPESHQPAHLEVVREFHASIADGLRASLGNQTHAEVVKNYLQVYGQQFAGIESDGALTIRDDREHDRLEIEARYKIRDPWQWSDEKRQWEFSVHPTIIGGFLEKPDVAGRTAPLATSYPQSVSCSLELAMPRRWPVTPETRNVSDPAFDFGFASRADGRTIHYAYTYVSLADHVSTSQLPAYAAAVEKANGLLTRILTLRKPQEGINPWAWLVVILTLIGAAIATPRLYRYSPPSSAPPDLPRQPLDGWLAFVALRVCLGPIYTVVAMWRARAFFMRDGWAQLVDPISASFQPSWGALILIELVVQTVCLTYGCLVAVTFFRRRTSFPFHFTVLSIVIVVFTGADSLASRALGGTGQYAVSIRGFIMLVAIAALFVRYVRDSPQAKRTFTRP